MSNSGMPKGSRLPITGHSPPVSLYPLQREPTPLQEIEIQAKASRQRNNSKMSLCHVQRSANCSIFRNRLYHLILSANTIGRFQGSIF
jgi:hypothetical protein